MLTNIQFWWSNVLQSDVNTFPENRDLEGYSAFREIQLLIDGMLAGVVWPFPVIFTGGVVHGLWRPLVGIDAFDLKEDEIDITPWLPILCDGKEHSFEIRVSGLDDDGNGTAVLSETVGSYWLVTGKIFIWLAESDHITTGKGPYGFTPAPSLEVSSSVGKLSNGTNDTLSYHVHANRQLAFDSTIELSFGKRLVSWRQYSSFTNNGIFSNGGNVEINVQHTFGYELSSNGYARDFSYPLYAYSSVGHVEDNFTIEATVDRGKDVKTYGEPVFPIGFEPASSIESRNQDFDGAWLATSQNGQATYLANNTAKTSFSFGTTEQDFSFYGIHAGFPERAGELPSLTGKKELFHRYVEAVNGTIVQDDDSLIGEMRGEDKNVVLQS